MIHIPYIKLIIIYLCIFHTLKSTNYNLVYKNYLLHITKKIKIYIGKVKNKTIFLNSKKLIKIMHIKQEI